MSAATTITRRIGEMAATLWDLLGLADAAPADAAADAPADAPTDILNESGDDACPSRARSVSTADETSSIDAPSPTPSPIPSSSPSTSQELVRGGGSRRRVGGSRAAAGSMQSRYDDLVREMKRVHGVRVVRWRSSTSGCAWQVYYADGSTARLIESPYPRGPMSCAVFLHEIGHHAIGFGTYRPRCLEEYHAWRWSFEAMIAGGFNVTEAVRRRRDEALHHAIRKAVRRGLKRLPVELAPFVPVPDRAQPPLPALLGGMPADDAA